MVTFEIMNIVQVQQIQARRQGGFEGFRSNPPLAPKDFIYTAIVHFKCRTSPLVSLLLRITAVQASLIVVSRSHTPFRKRGKGSGNFFYSSLLRHSTVLDQSQRTIQSHECCYHNFSRKLQGVNQLGNHKHLLCDFVSLIKTNYAVLAQVIPTLSIPTSSIPIWSMLTKRELTKWELTKWEVDEVGRFTI